MKNFLAILLVAIPLAAQISPVALTLTQARQLALAHSPQIAAARDDLAAAEARIKIARSSLYPRVTFSGIAKAGLSGATNSLGLIGLPNSPFYRNFAASLNLSQTIFDFGQRAALIDAAERRRQAAAADLDNTQAAIFFEVERAYWKLLRAQLLTTASNELLKARRGGVRKAEAFYAAQYRSGLAVDEARSALALAQVEVQQRTLDTLESHGSERQNHLPDCPASSGEASRRRCGCVSPVGISPPSRPNRSSRPPGRGSLPPLYS